MALPTVQYDRTPAGVNSSLVSIIMPKLQTLLFAAGWTIVAADADAIGTGTAAVPAWDKTPVAFAGAGKAIYLMPANGFTRQWYIEIEPYWHNATNFLGYRFRVGTGESAGALTGATTWTYNFQPSSSTTSLEVLLAVSEDGLVITHLGTTSGASIVASVERARTMAGVVGEDLVIQGWATTATSGSLLGFSNGDCARLRASDGFEYAIGKWFGLAPSGSSFANWTASSNLSVNNMSNAAGEVSVPVGPFAFSGEAAGVPRLVFYLHAINVIPDTDHPVFVDGATRLYRTPTPNISTLVPLVARE